MINIQAIFRFRCACRIYLSVIFFQLASSVFAQALPELIPYIDGKLWGYADTNGTVQINPKWTAAGLFHGNSAVVEFIDSGTGYNCYALVDKKGAYIIPPSRHWNGTWSGWKGQLNSFDEQGDWGQIDTQNNVTIPFKWEQSFTRIQPDSLYKVVTQNGLAGVIDHNNKLIIPCLYHNVNIFEEINGIMTFMVTSATSPYLYGVVDAYGTMLVPLRYNEIKYGIWTEGTGFRTRRLINNDDQRNPEYEGSFISISDGIEVKRKNATIDYYRERYIRQGNYYIYDQDGQGYALLDTNRNTVIPCCKVIAANYDTIFLRERATGYYTSTVSTTYLDAFKLTPLAPAQIVMYYEEENESWPQVAMCGNGVLSWQEARERDYHKPQLNYEGRLTRSFFKDYLFLEVQGYTGDGPFPATGSFALQGGYIADMAIHFPRSSYGSTHSGDCVTVCSTYIKDSLGSFRRQPFYSAVLDGNAGYIVKPLPDGYYIAGFNRHDGLVTARNGTSGGGLFNTNGKLITEIKGKEPRGAFKYKNKIYTYVAAESEQTGKVQSSERTSFYWEEKIKLADAHGVLITELSSYFIVGAIIREGKTTALAITDAQGMMGVFSPAGEDLFPEVNFKYRYLNVSDEGLILAKDSLRGNGKLVDRHNKDLLNGLRLSTIFQKVEKINPLDPQLSLPQHYQSINGLYIANIRSEEGNHTMHQIYIDRNGRIYK
ncbi:WG repeat-containing protein [Sphingobacterium sp. KU25419]|nr:WG repeat-containing protein [Sphingobacterium sp. KU25419]